MKTLFLICCISCSFIFCFATEVQIKNDFVVVNKGQNEYVLNKNKVSLMKKVKFDLEFYLICSDLFSCISISEKQYSELKNKL